MDAFAHLHPSQTDSLVFVGEVPSAPGGTLPAVRRHHAREWTEPHGDERREACRRCPAR